MQVSASESKHVYACMHVLKAQAATNLQTRLFANIGMLQLTVKFFRCKPPYQFQEDITVGVREQATSEEVAETCAERVLEVSREHGEPFGLENVSLFASKPRKLFVLGKASEYFRDGDDVHICGECVRSNSHGDRDRQDERAAASEPAAAASACESKPGVQRRAEGDRGGRPISARNAVAHLRDAVQDHLSAIFLISKHGSAERRQEAQCILDRYKGRNFSYHIGWDKNPSSPLADWNRMGAYVMSSFVHVERSYAAAQANLRKAEFFEKMVGKKSAAKMATKPECFAAKVKKLKCKSAMKQEAGKAKAGYLKPWTDALKKARENLGITGKVCAKKDSEYYKEAKRLQREGT